MIRTICLALIVTFLMLSCASSEYVRRPPQVDNIDMSAKVTLVRCKSMWGAAVAYDVYLDGKLLLKMKHGYYTTFRLPADQYNREHTVQVILGKQFRQDPLAMAVAPGMDQVNLICKPGEDIYIVLDVSNKQDYLRRVPREEAEPCLAEAVPM